MKSAYTDRATEEKGDASLFPMMAVAAAMSLSASLPSRAQDALAPGVPTNFVGTWLCDEASMIAEIVSAYIEGGPAAGNLAGMRYVSILNEHGEPTCVAGPMTVTVLSTVGAVPNFPRQDGTIVTIYILEVQYRTRAGEPVIGYVASSLPVGVLAPAGFSI